MSEIRLRADDARAEADHIRSEASAAQDQISALRTRLSGLGDSFTGQAATAFDGSYQEWHAGAEQMLAGLDGLGGFLASAANAIEQTDAQIAAQING